MPGGAIALLCAAALVLWLAPAGAAAAQVSFTSERCAPEVFDEDQVRALLSLELRPNLELAGPGAIQTGGRRVRVVCSAGTQGAVLYVDDGPAEALSFADVPVRMRARTLALAVAEVLRREPTPPAAPVVAPRPAPASRPQPPAPRVASQRERVLGGVTLGLFGLSVVGFAVGSPIAAVGNSDPERGDLRVASAYLLSLSVAPLVASSVTFGLWLRERRARR
jgi:hypothetical protein